MMDVLAAKGSVEILFYMKSLNIPVSIPEINQYFNSEKLKTRLTTATVYRRVKELQLVGFISKSRDSKVFLTDYGQKCLLDIQGEEIQLKKSRRGILNIIQREITISMSEIQNHGYSPVTIQRSVQDLEHLELVEKDLKEKSIHPQKKAGRPKKLIKLTKKGKNYLKIKEKLEEDSKK
jgi:DNA-binding MarR family transcriptional regulator